MRRFSPDFPPKQLALPGDNRQGFGLYVAIIPGGGLGAGPARLQGAGAVGKGQGYAVHGGI